MDSGSNSMSGGFLPGESANNGGASNNSGIYGRVQALLNQKAAKKKQEQKKRTAIWIGTAVGAVVIVIIGIVVIVNLNSEKMDVADCASKGSAAAIASCVEKNCEGNECAEGYVQIVSDDVADMNSKGATTEEVMTLYDEYLNEVEEETYAAVLIDRAYYLLSKNFNGEYNEQVMADAYKVDEMLQSISSAAAVINIAASCGEADVVEEYFKIMEQRQEEAGGVLEDYEGVG